MTAFLRIGGALAAEEDGATAIEYALLAAMIAAVLITVVQLAGRHGRRRLHQDQHRPDHLHAEVGAVTLMLSKNERNGNNSK